MSKIVSVNGLEILDSRGNPTLAARVVLAGGASGRASVPSGASTGRHEALELRDADPRRYAGKGVKKAIANLEGEIADALIGLDATDQAGIDRVLCELDGTPGKSRLGANAILAASLATAHAAAGSRSLPLYRYLAGDHPVSLPLPMMNVINGGAHANNRLDIQECMIVPLGFERFSDALHAGVKIFHTLRRLLDARGFPTSVGDEGGFAPDLRGTRQALDLIMSAIEQAGYRPGRDIALALDCAASEFYSDRRYVLAGEDKVYSESAFPDYLAGLAEAYPIVSIEDGMAEDDQSGWRMLSERLGERLQLVGDDLFVTQIPRLSAGIKEGIANAILIKPNQVGTLSETLAAIELALNSGYGAVVSHRSGETGDTTIADLAVASNCGQIKTGSLSRSDRVEKYNRLLQIEQELGDRAVFAGRNASSHFRLVA